MAGGTAAREAREVPHEHRAELERETPDETARADFAAVVASLGEIARAAGSGASVSVRERVPPGVLLAVAPVQLRRVVLNLVVNARRACAEGDGILVEFGVARTSRDLLERHPQARPGDHAVITVIDSGPGIRSAMAGRPYGCQVGGGRSEAGGGTGLRVVEQIVRSGGGFVTVESAYGHGTAVRVFLPVEAPDTGRPC